VEGTGVEIGGPRLLTEGKVSVPLEVEKLTTAWASDGKTVLYAVAQGRLLGAFAVEDENSGLRIVVTCSAESCNICPNIFKTSDRIVCQQIRSGRLGYLHLGNLLPGLKPGAIPPQSTTSPCALNCAITTPRGRHASLAAPCSRTPSSRTSLLWAYCSAAMRPPFLTKEPPISLPSQGQSATSGPGLVAWVGCFPRIHLPRY
jgi:hypothetical protein